MAIPAEKKLSSHSGIEPLKTGVESPASQAVEGLPNYSTSEYYFKRGLETPIFNPRQKPRRKLSYANSNFYLLYHLFQVHTEEFVLKRLNPYREGYLKKLMTSGYTEEEARAEIAQLEAQAKERVRLEALEEAST